MLITYVKNDDYISYVNLLMLIMFYKRNKLTKLNKNDNTETVVPR